MTRAAIARAYALDDAAMRAQLDRLAALAARICETPVALLSIVLEDEQIFLGRSGLAVDGTPREQSFCAHAMFGMHCMVVPDAREDARFEANPLVTGQPGIRFYAGQPLASREGAPLGAFCVIDDKPRAALSEEQQDALRTLAEAAMALLEKWRAAVEHQHQREAAHSELAQMVQRFHTLADVLPQIVWSAGPNGVLDFASAQWASFTGMPGEAAYEAGWRQSFHPEDLPRAGEGWRACLATGEPFELKLRLRRHDGEYCWMLARALPMQDAEGEVSRWMGTFTDIHEQVQTSELLELMSQELSHRIKNLFAVVQGLIAMTLRAYPELAPVAGEMQSRLLALGRAHDMVRPQIVGAAVWQSATSLRQMLEQLLAPYSGPDSGGSQRWRITGGDVLVGENAATPLALFFHELATNAAKYGALSSEAGMIDIAIDNAGEGQPVEIRWQESGGPEARAPTHRGFGYRLVELSVVRQLGGDMDFNWQPEGLVVTASLPYASLGAQPALAD